jgi:hypothetical protein
MRIGIGDGGGELVHAVGKIGGEGGVYLREIGGGVFALEYDTLGEPGAFLGEAFKVPFERECGTVEGYVDGGGIGRSYFADDPVKWGLARQECGAVRAAGERAVQGEFCGRVVPVGDVRPVIPGEGESRVGVESVGEFPADGGHGCSQDDASWVWGSIEGNCGGGEGSEV